MFKFGKKKRYSLGEKINYFNSIINSNCSIKKKNWAKNRLNSLMSIKNSIKLGDVFIVNDRLMGNKDSKPRAVVILKTKNNKVTVSPVRRNKTIFPLLNFDGDRNINLSYPKTISKNSLYPTRGFKKIKNCYLTNKEKVKLQKKVK